MRLTIRSGGYAALLFVVATGSTLLMLIISSSETQFILQKYLLALVWKRQSQLAAQSCGDQALLYLAENHVHIFRDLDKEINMAEVHCKITDISTDPVDRDIRYIRSLGESHELTYRELIKVRIGDNELELISRTKE